MLACADNFADPDLWRHLLVGHAILSTGHIPSHDVYSYTVAGFATRNHEWLAEAIFAFAYQWWGILGLKLIKIACATIAISALAAGLATTAASVRIQRAILILSAGALTTQIQFRPQLFTFAMLSIVMATLATEVYRGGARWWPLVPMFALWANLHGGFATGLGALGIAAAVMSAQELVAGTLPRRGFRLGCVTALAALATIINPLGVGIWSNVLHSVSDPLLRLIINDWVPLPRMMLFLWNNSAIGLLQVVLAVGLFGGFLFSIARAPTFDDAPLTAIGIVFVIAAFYMTRNVALGVIAVAIPLAHHLALAMRWRSDTEPAVSERELSPTLIGSVIAVVVLVCGVVSPRLRTWEPVPEGAVAFMRDHKLHGNILNHFEWGDYLVWHLPASRIFIDVRAELLYPDEVMREYAEFFYAKPGAQRALDEHPTDLVLVKSMTGGSRVVERDSAWKIIYQDNVATLFAPASSPIEPAIDVTKADTSPTSYFP